MHAATHAARTFRVAGLHDLPGGTTLFVPALREGRSETSLLSLEESIASWSLAAKPQSLAPSEGFDDAFVADPLPIRPSRLLHLADARAVGRHAVLVDPLTGHLYEDSLAATVRMPRMIALRRGRTLARAQRFTSRVCVLQTYVAESYFHFLFDVLSRLYGFSDDGQADLAGLRANAAGVTFVVDAHGPMWQRDFLDLLGLDWTTVAFDERTNLVAEDLAFPTYVVAAHPRVRALVLPAPIATWMRRIFREAAATGDTGRRIYITRRNAETRRVANENEVAEVLGGRGFESIAAEELSAREQVAAFAAAECIAAPHGAGLTNMLFTDPGTVVELVSPQHIVPSLYLLGEALGHAYWYVLGTVASDQPLNFTADFSIAADALDATLDQALAGRSAS